MIQYQFKYLKSVYVSADFHGKYQSGEAKEAKHSLCSVINDIFHFRCFIMMHKLNFKFYVTDMIGHSRIQPCLLGED